MRCFREVATMNTLILPDVKCVNVNNRESRQGAITSHFRLLFKQSSFKNLLLSIVTFGVYPYQKYKTAKRGILQALSSRKLLCLQALQHHIETIRQQQEHSDPRQSINAIFMKVQSEKISQEEDALEFKAIYYPNEVLLFITNPVRDRHSIPLHGLKSRKQLDYTKIWHELKKKAWVNQFRQIQNINLCNKTLKEEYYLTSEGIHDRLRRSSMGRKTPYVLTKFRELGKAFQEIVVAYQDFEELSEQNPKLFHLIETLSKSSKKDIEILQTYLASRYLPQDLPLANRRQLIQLVNQQDVLYHMSEEEQFFPCALLLNHDQWDFLLSIQTGSHQSTLGLLNWAFEESPKAMKRELSFTEQLFAGIWSKVQDDVENFPNLNEKIQEDPSLKDMTLDFAKEINRVWPSLHLYQEEQVVFHMQQTDSFTIDKMIEVYFEIGKLCGEDNILFCLIQQALSQVGKHAFQSAIEEGVMKLLGEKSEFFLSILSNSGITVIKRGLEEVEICYAFEQLITKKGEAQHPFEKEKYMIITQPLIKKEGRWTSPEAKVAIALKKGMP